MKRYRIVWMYMPLNDDPPKESTVFESEVGEWVKWEDYQNEIDAYKLFLKTHGIDFSHEKIIEDYKRGFSCQTHLDS